jgi:hypothetical protein
MNRNLSGRSLDHRMLQTPIPIIFSLAGAVMIAGAFALSHYLQRFTARIKQRWQALSAGVAVAYVFVNVIPELEEHRPTIAGSATVELLDIEKRVYCWALAGFVSFAGLSGLRFRKDQEASGRHGVGPVYWSELAGYSLYSLLIGYLLVHREDPSLLSLELFVSAIGLHLFIVNNELAEKFGRLYEPRGRFLLMACVVVGWVLGILHALPDSLTSRLFAFVVGGVVITAANQELPGGENRRFWWFAGGAACYAILLLLI